MPDHFAPPVADALLSRWVLLFGAARRLLTDQGANFESAVVQNLCTIWRIDKVRTPPYHPPGNGECERLNQTINRGLQEILNEQTLEEWDIVLSEVMLADKKSVHSTKSFAPYIVMFDVEALVPSKILIGLPEMECTLAAYAFR